VFSTRSRIRWRILEQANIVRVAPAAPGPNSHTVVNFGVAVRGTHSFDTDLSPVVITPTGYEVHAWVSSSHTLNGIGTFSAGPNGLDEAGVINM
jgi:hypothetical protein